MFKETSKDIQLDVFGSIPGILSGRTLTQYNNPLSWHNQFREHVLSEIDEKLFKELFDKSMGAPNASVRILLGMMIIKEGLGYSDIELYEQCRFNLLIRSALGLLNMSDTIPVESSYYSLRKKVVDHERQSGINLIEKIFAQVTSKQVIAFEVSGHSIRMDSKLIGSNIANYSRYEIIHQSIVLFYKGLSHDQISKLSEAEKNHLAILSKEDGCKVVYRSTRDEIKIQLQALGTLIYELLELYKGMQSQSYQIISRIFKEQYKIVDQGKIELNPKEEITSESLQSPHDTDCAYRKKDTQSVKGYSANVSETCNEESLNLITHVQVEKANTADNTFVVPGIAESQKVLESKIENVHADGAYNSQTNTTYCKEESINIHLTGIQGAAGRYDLQITPENNVAVIDSQSGEAIPATQTKNGKWKIKTEQGSRYFGIKEIESCLLRKKIENLPAEIKYKRNNVEATIFQLSLHNRNNKTKYRGMIKQKMWATFRCLWINLVRIKNHLKQICQKTNKTVQNKILNVQIFKNCISLLTQTLLLALNVFFIRPKQKIFIFLKKLLILKPTYYSGLNFTILQFYNFLIF